MLAGLYTLEGMAMGTRGPLWPCGWMHVDGTPNRDQPKGNARQAGDSGHAHCSGAVLRKLGEGATEDDLLQAYPQLTKQDIKAAIAYAADTLAHEETVLLEPKG
jgi:hypothetical protein